MANNINGNAPNAIVAKTTISFTAAGITSLNTYIIFLVGDPLLSFVPGRAINGISGFEAGKGYYMVAKVDMDLSAIVVPPLSSLTQLGTPGSFTATAASDTQINVSWASVTNATAYVVDRATNSGFTTGVTLGVYSSSGTSFNNTGLSASTTYYYRVRATAAGYSDSNYATANATTQEEGEAPTPPTEAILILSSGQSNEVGRAAADAGNEVTVPSTVWEYKPDSNTLVSLADPTGQAGNYTIATDRSLHPNLGKRLTELSGKPVIFVCTAKGATGIDTWLDTENVEYTNMLAWWNELIAYCSANGITVLNKFCHWLQGENDAGSLEPDGYLDKLNQMVTIFKEDFAIDETFVTRIGYDPSFTSAANSEKIMKAQNYADLSRDEMILTSRAASTFTTGNGKMKGDNVHYTVLGLNEIGEDVAEAMHRYRSLGKKVNHTTEPVTALQPAGGYFDDIYNFRSLKAGINADFNELYQRNNLTHVSGSTLSFDGFNGLEVGGVNPCTPATARDLLNTHDWTIEVTFAAGKPAPGIIISGRNSDSEHDSDWFWINDSFTVRLKANSGTEKMVELTGVDFTVLCNLALVYVFSTNTLTIYVNGVLKATVTDWSFTSFKQETFFRSQGSTPNATDAFEGVIERIRIVKRALSTWEFDRSPNISTPPAIDLDFEFNGNLNEAQGDLTASAFTFAGSSTTPTFDADGIVFNEGDYVRLSSKKTMAQATVEFRFKQAADSSDIDFYCGKNLTPDVGGFLGGIGKDGDTFYFCTETAVAFWDLTGITYTSFNIYKIVYNGTTAELFINASSKGTKSLTGNFSIAIIGAKHPTQVYSCKGTMDYFKVKNSL